MQPYERIEAWRSAHELALAVKAAVERWPAADRFGLSAQVRRAAFSVPLNIVEGRARRGPREFRRFLDIAWSSLAELEYGLRLARDLDYLTSAEFDRLELLRDKTAKPLFGLLRSMPA